LTSDGGDHDSEKRSREARDHRGPGEGAGAGARACSAVDVFENAHGITVEAEMPGVSKDRLNVQADRNSLLIEGDLVIDMPSGIEALYADVQATKYRRSFVLSGELENRSDRSEPQGRRAHGTHSQAGRVSAAQDRGPHSLTSSSPDVAVGTSGSQ